MKELFLDVVNISIAASWLILFILVIRVILKKSPRWIHVLLWGIAAIRLICPFSVESALSLIPSAETIPKQAINSSDFDIQTGIAPIDTQVNTYLEQHGSEEQYNLENGTEPVKNTSFDTITVLTIVWLSGIVALSTYTIVSWSHLQRKVDTAILYHDNIYQSENITSPFVLGIIKPRIYLPFQTETGNLEYVITHEQAHIRRKDYWWKPLGFLLLTIHWFNPLMWLSYVLLCRDIELACDEKVIKELNNEERADYSTALLACSMKRGNIAACPIAFGEIGVKERIKSILNYKRPSRLKLLIAIITLIIIIVCFLTNPITKGDIAIDTENGYYLLIGEEDIYQIEIVSDQISGGCQNADGTPYEKGEKVWLEPLDGCTELRGLSIIALDKEDQVQYVFSIPAYATKEEIINLIENDEWFEIPDDFIVMDNDIDFEVTDAVLDYIGQIEAPSIREWLVYQAAEEKENYFSNYNNQKLQTIRNTPSDPAISSDIIYYRNDTNQSLNEIVTEMITAIMEPFTKDDNGLPYVITDYKINDQVLVPLQDGIWLIPYLDIYMKYEGTTLAGTMDHYIKAEPYLYQDGYMPLIRQGSDEAFMYVLMEHNGVYRLQRLEYMAK